MEKSLRVAALGSSFVAGPGFHESAALSPDTTTHATLVRH